MSEFATVEEIPAAVERLVAAAQRHDITTPLLVAGSADAFSPVVAGLPDEWLRGPLDLSAGPAFEGLAAALSDAGKRWLDARPGLRQISEAVERLAARPLTAASFAPLGPMFATAHEPSLVVVVSQLDPADDDHLAVVDALVTMQDHRAPVVVVGHTPCHPSFLSWGGLLDVLDVFDAPLAAADIAAAVRRLSPDGRRYLRAIVSEPASHQELRARLGDSTAFGGASKLERDFAEIRCSGLIRSDAGILRPLSDTVVAALG